MKPQPIDSRRTEPAAIPVLDTGLAAALQKFRRVEEGALYPFGLTLLTLMLMMGGMALDLMRHEQKRTTLQQTLDRSTLAAASLQQSLDPESVVRDYFAKANMTQYLSGVTVDEGMNYREVNALAAADTNPFFMQMVGIDSFDAKAASTAEQRISNVEVSMVLDISGSMASNSRLTRLRPAAKEFIDTVINGSDPGRVSISVVPYNAQVNLGAGMMSQFNVNALHSTSYCVELPNSVFGSTGLSQATSFVHNGHFDPWGTGNSSNYNCPPTANVAVTPMSGDAAYLKGRVDLLASMGYTSIDVGVKWGTLLLDPSAQPLINGLVGLGQVDEDFTDRPLDPDEANVLKVLVVMSDGENTEEYKLTAPYRSGPSAIYKKTSNSKLTLYSDRASTTSDYYWFSDSKWHTTIDGGTTGSVQMTWPEVWAKWSVRYVAKDIYTKALGGSENSWFETFTDEISYGQKDVRLQQICDAAKDSGIVIFSIGFEAPENGRNQLRDCASQPSNYFNATGVQITTAFRAIATQLSHLRLTQ
ncbi:pilus assembly protein TadG-related protein [Rhodobacter ferrooxidans]|uniref:VWFA domain-containing protein n=1 Tax=Rhodobacter ferrooxidans TaxID=371731 RepID=C8S360_9RHOB|nr:pilus assembly protein TadG-related protein [Rhodobacter sp. SW2]EEW24542.1 conserved hypothetical protein [Rhodobacter sp. SW2]